MNMVKYESLFDAIIQEDISSIKEFLNQLKLENMNINNQINSLLVNTFLGNNLYSYNNIWIDIYSYVYEDINIDKKNKDGYTALIDATIINNTKIVKMLINAGVNINIKDTYNGQTALMCAIDEYNYEITIMLLKAGADINITCIDGYNALILASIGGYTNIVDMLLKIGADINAKDTNYEENALIIASQFGYIKIVKLLLKTGIDVNIQNKEKKTALIFARENNHTEIVKMLINAGAKL